MHIRSMHIGMRIGTCPYLFSNIANTATLYVLIVLPCDGLRCEKHCVFRGIVSTRIVPADWLHQAVQVSSERQDEKGVQPEETTMSVCPKRLVKALISSTLQLDLAIASTVCIQFAFVDTCGQTLSDVLCYQEAS